MSARLPYPALNVAVLQCASRCWPNGFDVGAVAPSTLEGLTHEIAERGRMTVWEGGSDRTIFGDPEVNYAFRAWHDWHHWRHQLPFTPEGEAAVARRQVEDLGKLYGPYTGRTLGRYVVVEVDGQARFFERWGAFPEDQLTFTRSALKHGIEYAVRNKVGGFSHAPIAA